MPKKRTEGGSYTLDTTIRGVGRLCVATGAKTLTEYRKRVAVIHKLRDTGRMDLLKAIRDGAVTVAEIYAADREGTLGWVLVDLVARRILWDEVDRWVPSSARAESTRTRYRGAWDAVRRESGLGTKAMVSDLGRVNWSKLYANWEKSAAHWNHMRRAVSRFLSATFGKRSPFRHTVLEQFPIAKESPRITDLSVREFQEVLHKMPEVYRPAFVTLAATGMRVRSEYLACTDMHVRNGFVHIPGTKTAGSDRISPVAESLWPWVRLAIPCPFTYDQLRRVWRRSCVEAEVPPTRLNDLRHCFAQWLSNAGRPLPSIQASMGHENIGTTTRYTKTTMKQEDADMMGSILVGISSKKKKRQKGQ